LTVRAPRFIDTTLRDGEQAPGVVFPLRDKMRLAELLQATGVEELEVGTPTLGQSELTFVHALVHSGLPLRTLSWCRAKAEDILLTAEAGTDGIHLSFPLSEVMLKAMGKERSWAFSQLRPLIRLASMHFEYVTVGVMDASRTRQDVLLDFVQQAVDAGACRIRLADTVGLLHPLSTIELIRSVRAVLPEVSLEFHAHNDLGLATANALVAFSAGADCLSTTIGGLGERAGNAAMEEVAMALECGQGVSCGLDTTRFSELTALVEAMSGYHFSPSKPVTGAAVFSHESGIHTHCQTQNPASFQPFPAARVGGSERPFLIGRHSGKATLAYYLTQAGLAFDEALLCALVRAVKRSSEYHQRALSLDELLQLYTHVHSH
jgi:homocitrate synthase NifV